MDVLTALPEDIELQLFAASAQDKAIVSELVDFSEGIELIGIKLSGELKFVLAFLRVKDAAGDMDSARGYAGWIQFPQDVELDPEARVIKFYRSGALPTNIFNPADWPIPKPFTIWGVQQALTEALNVYTDSKPSVRQFFFMPQSEALERWYVRVERSLSNAGRCAFHNIARPNDGEGGFHGFQRV